VRPEPAPQSILDREPLIRIWRPLYRGILEPYVWRWIGLSSRASPTIYASPTVPPPPLVPARNQAEVGEALARIEQRQTEIFDRLVRLEGASSIDWARLETLLICLWTDPSFPAPRAIEELRGSDER
jgi:hypothetical protein